VGNCVTNDAPDIAGLYSVIPRLLALPAGLLTPDFINLAKNFLSHLPPLPTSTSSSGQPIYTGGEKLPASTSNSENPELYVLHPYRIVTPSTRNIALNSYQNRRFVCNTGWCQDIMNAALLGLDQDTMKQVVQRANSAPAEGYRFDAFMPHFQDYQPSSDHLSNMNTALQWMLVQSDVDDNIILFPAWPCNEWNVEFKVYGPLNTVVEGVYKDGKIVSINVTPSSRTSAVKFAHCVS